MPKKRNKRAGRLAHHREDDDLERRDEELERHALMLKLKMLPADPSSEDDEQEEDAEGVGDGDMAGGQDGGGGAVLVSEEKLEEGARRRPPAPALPQPADGYGGGRGGSGRGGDSDGDGDDGDDGDNGITTTRKSRRDARKGRRAAKLKKKSGALQPPMTADQLTLNDSKTKKKQGRKTTDTATAEEEGVDEDRDRKSKRANARKAKAKPQPASKRSISGSSGGGAAASSDSSAQPATTAQDKKRERRERLQRHLQQRKEGRLKIWGSLPDYLYSVPNELWAMIIDFLDKKDLLTMSSVSTDWRWLALAHHRHHRVHNFDDLIPQLDFLTANCPGLQSLMLTGWWSVGMGDEFKHLPPTLEHLDISNCTHVLDSHLKLLPPELLSLNLSGCHNICSAGLANLPTTLERLDLSECFLISDAGLRNLSGVMGKTKDEIDEEERERERLQEEERRKEEEEAERKRRKGKDKAEEEEDDTARDDAGPEAEGVVDPAVIAALPELVSDDEDDQGGTTAVAAQPREEAIVEKEPAPIRRPVVETAPFPHLRALSLHKCFAVSSLEFLPQTLEELDISHLNLNFPDNFSILPPTLKKLTVADCRVTNSSLWDLPPSLTYLDLTRCFFIDDDGLQALYSMPFLKTLIVRGCSRILGDGLVSLPPGLEQLVISETNIADESLDTLPESLRKLDLSFTSISNRALQHLPRQLEELNLAWCKHIDDEGLTALPVTLRGLSLEDNAKNISDQALAHLYANAKALQVLNLVGCDRVSDEGLRWLPRTLKTLCLGLRPPNISKRALRELQMWGSLRVKVMESQRRKVQGLLLQAAK